MRAGRLETRLPSERLEEDDIAAAAGGYNLKGPNAEIREARVSGPWRSKDHDRERISIAALGLTSFGRGLLREGRFLWQSRLQDFSGSAP